MITRYKNLPKKIISPISGSELFLQPDHKNNGGGYHMCIGEVSDDYDNGDKEVFYLDEFLAYYQNDKTGERIYV
tara:strand:- start:2 stop:223 length:222 start_codon:yes stop_codon:yes gene_type:complete